MEVKEIEENKFMSFKAIRSDFSFAFDDELQPRPRGLVAWYFGPVRNLSARLKSVEHMKGVQSSTCATPGKRAVAPPAPGV
jgi:hypothetical protein